MNAGWYILAGFLTSFFIELVLWSVKGKQERTLFLRDDTTPIMRGRNRKLL